MDVEQLLAPISDDAPAGEDLSYDAERQQIEDAFDAAGQGGESAEAVDWRETIRTIEQQSQRTKDVWLAVYLARAGARMGRLETVVAGCEMLAGLFERYWDAVHPTLEEYGFQGRKGPCESLTRIGEFLGPFRRTILIEHPRLGRYTGEDFERFAVEGASADGFGLFRAAINETAEEDLAAALEALDAMRGAIVRADAVLTEHAEGDTATNFQPTYEVIDSIRRAVAPYAGAEVEQAAEADGGDSAASPGVAAFGGGASTGAGLSGRVQSRDDVIKAIDAVCEYYDRAEPGSPIPVALQRVRGWVTMDFMAILRDIAPGSIAEAGNVLLSRPPDEDNSGY